jgi:hypothetical protein
MYFLTSLVSRPSSRGAAGAAGAEARERLLRAPVVDSLRDVAGVEQLLQALDVAAQVEFERANFETGFSLYRLKG